MIADFLNDSLWGDSIQTRVVTELASLIAVDATRTAWKVCFYNIIIGLLPAEESRPRMSSPPDTYHLSVYERGKVHICGVHRDKATEVLHDEDFIAETLAKSRCIVHVGEFLAPFFEHLLLFLPSSEK